MDVRARNYCTPESRNLLRLWPRRAARRRCATTGMGTLWSGQQQCSHIGAARAAARAQDEHEEEREKRDQRPHPRERPPRVGHRDHHLSVVLPRKRRLRARLNLEELAERSPAVLDIVDEDLLAEPNTLTVVAGVGGGGAPMKMSRTISSPVKIPPLPLSRLLSIASRLFAWAAAMQQARASQRRKFASFKKSQVRQV